MKQTYFVDNDGVIYTIFNDKTTNHYLKSFKVVENVNRKNEIELIDSDGFVFDTFTIHNSLSELEDLI